MLFLRQSTEENTGAAGAVFVLSGKTNIKKIPFQPELNPHYDIHLEQRVITYHGLRKVLASLVSARKNTIKLSAREVRQH